MDRRAEQAERAEDQRARRAPGRRRRRPRSAQGSSSVVARGTHGADHREASGRPGAREPDEQPRSARAPRSALDLRVVVHDAEHLAAAVAVARQRGVAVDPVRVARSSRRACGRGPRSSDTRRRRSAGGSRSSPPGLRRRRASAAPAGADCRRDRAAGRRPGVDGPAARVDRADRGRRPASRPRRAAGSRSVDSRQPGRVRAGAGRVDVAAEVVGLGLLGAQGRREEASAGHAEEQPPRPGDEPSPRGRARDASLTSHAPPSGAVCDALQLEERVERALGEHLAVGGRARRA